MIFDFSVQRKTVVDIDGDFMLNPKSMNTIKNEAMQRIRKVAEHAVSVVQNSLDPEAGYSLAYSFSKLALYHTLGTYSKLGNEELKSSQAYDEGLDYVIAALEVALKKRKSLQ